ncbi:MAG: hypothetical protein HW380_2971 [Magnetococcales bacterium]|nr:hypothetical protein [Magnetococcales bacterium]HIJ84806.1 hypothetical protein [Magnetococcales bacterium]
MSIMIIYSCFAFVLTILGGYFSLVEELKKDIAKLSELQCPNNFSQLHNDEWKLMRLVYLRGCIYIRHKKLSKWLFPAFALSVAAAILLVLGGIMISNIVGISSVFGFAPDKFGELLVGGGATLLILYVLYFRVATFLLIQNSSSLEKLL